MSLDQVFPYQTWSVGETWGRSDFHLAYNMLLSLLSNNTRSNLLQEYPTGMLTSAETLHTLEHLDTTVRDLTNVQPRVRFL